MNILMLSWEYPPREIGGLSNHVFNLSFYLHKLGHGVKVVTCEAEKEFKGTIKEDLGVKVFRVSPYNLNNEDFAKWVMHLNFAMIEECAKIINSGESFDVIHAHDWLVTYAAKAVGGIYNIPVISTIHATEHGRNNGIHNEIQRYIHSVEVLLAKEARSIIICSNYMKNEVNNILGVPSDKLSVIPNGVNCKENIAAADLSDIRLKYAKPHEKIVFYIGRHVFEKGIQVLIDGIPKILKRAPEVKFVIAGVGPMTEELRAKAREMNLDDRVAFTGHLEETMKANLYKLSEVSVFPSFYEPFGIVALEAMAQGCPVVASHVGGFAELIESGINGILVKPASSEDLAENIIRLLEDGALAQRIGENGLKLVKNNYSWSKIAALTARAYENIL